MPALALFLLSPLVAEFLLGNLPLVLVPGVLALAPLYGGAAVLIRESTRRLGRGWPTMLLLGVGYGLFEEGLVTQMLFNRDYYGEDLMGDTYVPGLGIGAEVTVGVLALHAIWSIGTAIAMVEALVPSRRTEPWLGRRGLVLVTVVFVAGTIWFGVTEWQENRFVAHPARLLVTAVLVVALVVLALRIDARPVAARPGVRPPSAWVVGTLSLGALSALAAFEPLPGWVATGCLALALGGLAWLLLRWSARPGWTALHTTAAASGALLTYAWQGFVTDPIIGPTGAVDTAGNAVLAVLAVGFVVVACRRSAGAGASPAPLDDRGVPRP